MPDFNVRSDSVNVEQIMEQIRARVREKRGVDYTEQQIRELAAVKLEKFLDPRGVRSDLLEQFRRLQPAYEPPELPNYAFEETTLFESHRGPIRWIRRLLQPILKLFFNPNPLIQALHIQSRLNALNAERSAREHATRRGLDQLYFEVMHNLVIETTRLGIDVKNLKMRVESLASRLEFNERRARALEGVVAYKPSNEGGAERAAAAAGPAPSQPSMTAHPPTPSASSGSRVSTVEPSTRSGQPLPTGSGQAGAPEGPGQRSHRRRRRRGRRGGRPAVAMMSGPGQAASTHSASSGSTVSAVEPSTGEGPAAATPEQAASTHSVSSEVTVNTVEPSTRSDQAGPTPVPNGTDTGEQ